MTQTNAPEPASMEIESPLRSGGSNASGAGAGRAEAVTPEGKAGGQDARADGADPKASDTPDLSHVHESLKERVKDWPKEALDALRTHYVPKADYTRQRQQEKAELKRLSSLAQGGERWQQMMANPDLVKHMLAYGEKQAQPTADAAEPDWDAMTPKEIVRELTARQKREREQMISELVPTVVAQTTAPQRAAAALTKAATEWRDENEIDGDAFNAAVELLDKSPIRKHLTPENVGDYLAEALERRKMQQEIEGLRSKAGTFSAPGNGQARAASPRGASGGSAPDARSIQQMIEAGKSPGDAAYEMMLRKRGKTEREMDAEMGFSA